MEQFAATSSQIFYTWPRRVFTRCPSACSLWCGRWLCIKHGSLSLLSNMFVSTHRLSLRYQSVFRRLAVTTLHVKLTSSRNMLAIDRMLPPAALKRSLRRQYNARKATNITSFLAQHRELIRVDAQTDSYLTFDFGANAGNGYSKRKGNTKAF